MKKILIGVGITLAIILVAGYLFRAQLFMLVMGSRIAPDQTFSETTPPAAPDYTQSQNWAALPETEDPADEMPAMASRNPTGVAVFFLHPTSYFGKTWNQPLEDESANWLVDERILRHQASVFSSCCDIYAPRYRQATFFSFMDNSGDGEQALTLAYGDVVSAFNAFLEKIEPDQPFVVAGHSQGTRHATQLVREKITGTPLQDRMVAAYLVGFSVTYDQLGDLPACESAAQYGCAVGWNAMEGEEGGAFGGDEKLLCTNPLSWEDSGGHAAHDLNTGAIGYPTYGPAIEGEDVTQMNVEVGIADASCLEDGQLAVLDLRSEAFPARMMGASMHVYDYSLYHMNIRQNVSDRIAAYMSR